MSDVEFDFPKNGAGEKMVGMSMRLPQWMVDRLQGIADVEQCFRNDVAKLFLSEAIKEYDRQVNERSRNG